MEHSSDVTTIFELTTILELPFLIATVVFAFLVASQLKGGVFGKGMTFIAWGALVMAVGHLHMQIEMLFDFNLFQNLFGYTLGSIIWGVALLTTWSLTSYGFYSIYKSSKG